MKPNRKLVLVSCVGIALALSSPAAAQAPDPITNAAQLEAAIAESHRALEAILNGDPGKYLALFADREDITLGNPFGPFGQGRAAVGATLANAANKYQRGTARVERVALYGDEHLVCLAEIEHDRAQLTGSDEFAEFSVRVTSIHERIGDEWKLVHRHADPITAPRTAQSVIGK
ncbi:nuclear transport factor 2 family protein [Altererythrobacter aquiaggeris]|uniref:YybH family protein n=1 Tax=Aestuarierythrobacter aquiaggeris TaxID=1898396 RepID=UPI0030193DA4